MNVNTTVSQSVSFFTVPHRAHPSTGSQSGSATPGLTQQTRQPVLGINLLLPVYPFFLTDLPGCRTSIHRARDPPEQRFGNFNFPKAKVLSQDWERVQGNLPVLTSVLSENI